jgi:hypothetical protein
VPTAPAWEAGLYRKDQELWEALALLEAEKAALVKADAKRAEDDKAIAEYDRLKAQQELGKIFGDEDNPLTSLDPKDAKRLPAPVYERQGGWMSFKASRTPSEKDGGYPDVVRGVILGSPGGVPPQWGKPSSTG